LLGFLLLYGGGELLVSSGKELGLLLGVPAFVISAVFVAFGTSFPELVTAVVACIKKKDTDLITGNILGSNVFNVALILGSLSLYKLPLEEAYQWEVIALMGGTLVMVALGVTKLRLHRLFGALFLGVYGAMIFYWIS
jgi:cation:H+ antiporter